MDTTQSIRMTPRDFFHYLGILIALYIATPTLIALLVSIIDVAYPPVERYYSTPSISWPVAALIVLFPIYAILSWMLQKRFVEQPARKDLWIRKWFIYITLFITAAVMVGDLIMVLYYFLDGQIITTGFILKVLAVFVVVGSIFLYYISDLRDRLSLSRRKLFVGISTLLVLGSIILGFIVIGSPRTQRLMRYDQMKVSDLQSIQGQIVYHFQQKQQLPITLEELNDPLSGYILPTDPETKALYEYQRVSTTSFKLCATFNRPTNIREQSMAQDYYMRSANENWIHDVGRVCFDRTIDPQKYPPLNQKPIQ
ncbi:MAG: DUF5671 domain-containing protein [bacterium]|nr:DUF5671 domain-containing protein [bacterium]